MPLYAAFQLATGHCVPASPVADLQTTTDKAVGLQLHQMGERTWSKPCTNHATASALSSGPKGRSLRQAARIAAVSKTERAWQLRTECHRHRLWKTSMGSRTSLLPETNGPRDHAPAPFWGCCESAAFRCGGSYGITSRIVTSPTVTGMFEMTVPLRLAVKSTDLPSRFHFVHVLSGMVRVASQVNVFRLS